MVELRDSTGGGATGSSILPSKTGGGSGDAAGFMGVSSADMAFQKQKSKKEYQWFEGMFKSINKFLPMLGVAGGIYALVKSSQVSQAALGSISSILGAMVDVFLVPLMPLFMKILEVLTPLVPIVGVLAEKIFGPIVKIMTEIFSPIADAIKWLADKLGFGGGKKGSSQEPTGPVTSGELTGAAAETALGATGGVLATRSAGWLLKKFGMSGAGALVSSPLLSVPVGFIAGLIALSNTTAVKKMRAETDEYLEQQRLLEERNRNQRYSDAIDETEKTLGSETARLLEEALKGGSARAYPQKHLGGYIAKTGLYELERGEEVRRASSSSMQTAPIYVENIFQNSFATTVNVDEFMATIEQRITESVKNAIRRAR